MYLMYVIFLSAVCAEGLVYMHLSILVASKRPDRLPHCFNLMHVLFVMNKMAACL